MINGIDSISAVFGPVELCSTEESDGDRARVLAAKTDSFGNLSRSSHLTHLSEVVHMMSQTIYADHESWEGGEILYDNPGRPIAERKMSPSCSRSLPLGCSWQSGEEQKYMKFPAALFFNYSHRCLPLNGPTLSQHGPRGLSLTWLLPTDPLQSGVWLSYTTPGELPLSCSISPCVPSGWRKKIIHCWDGDLRGIYLSFSAMRLMRQVTSCLREVQSRLGKSQFIITALANTDRWSRGFSLKKN